MYYLQFRTCHLSRLKLYFLLPCISQGKNSKPKREAYEHGNWKETIGSRKWADGWERIKKVAPEYRLAGEPLGLGDKENIVNLYVKARPLPLNVSSIEIVF